MVALCLSVAACGVAAANNARDNMQQSLALYKACLADHPQDVTPCQGARLAYEADLKAYSAMLPGKNNTLNVNTSTNP